jgi:hypothetical protein
VPAELPDGLELEDDPLEVEPGIDEVPGIDRDPEAVEPEVMDGEEDGPEAEEPSPVSSPGVAACCRRCAFSEALSETWPQAWRSSTRVSSNTERTSLIKLVSRSCVSENWVCTSVSRK